MRLPRDLFLLGRFRRRHLYDYPPAAAGFWLIVVSGGALVGLTSIGSIGLNAGAWFSTVVAAVPVLVAAQFPIRVPRTKIAFSGSDVFLFATLAFLGPAAAILIGGLDSAIGSYRRSRRLSSRLAGPATSMLAMGAAAGVQQGLEGILIGAGVAEGPSALGALSLAGLVHYGLNTGLQHSILSFKRQERFRPSDFVAETGWMGAASMLSAFVASLVILTTGRLGFEGVLVSALVGLIVLVLINHSLRRVESQLALQESLVESAREEARVNQQRFTSAFERAAGGLALVGSDGKVLRVNPALSTLLQRPEQSLIGQPFLQIVAPEDQVVLGRNVSAALHGADDVVAMEVRLARPTGDVWVSLHASRFEDPGASGTGLIYQLHDITDRRAAQEQLQFAAYHDGLTSLPNRLAFLQRLQAAIDRSRADPGATFAALMLDLDRFKMVNDSLGHSAGNDLLVEVARRLDSSVRPGDYVARLGGDEFGLMFDRISSQEEAVRLAQRVAETIAQPMQIASSEFSVQCSIGLTLSDLGHRSADEMIRDADIAMYDAKGKGRGRISVFDTPMHDYVADRLYMEAELRRAISAGQISLAYQPIVILGSRKLLGFEALARWHHPEMGTVEVPKFINLAEESGFIAQLTPWVIEMASLQMAAWQRLLPDGERLKMHVNISARDLELPGFTTSVATALARARLSGHSLTLEITETSLMRSMEHALPVMESLRRLGVGFSIDDFGTGYSSLSYLSSLPIESLKIDRSFVLGMDRGPQNVEIVRAILRLGQTLHMHVIAEGVETPEHLDGLRDIGVEAGQGYLFSRPLPPAKLLAQLEQAGLRAT